MNKKLVKGTALLTLSGIICRAIGFFYKIFLSRTIGAEGLGLYQLITPVLLIGVALSQAGIQTAISRLVSFDSKHSGSYFRLGLLISSLLSLIYGFLIFFGSDWIATTLLGDARAAQMIRILCLALIPSGIRSCVNGYYYGKKKTTLPAVCQIIEQLARVGGVYVLFLICNKNHQTFFPYYAAWGIVLGEVAGLLTCCYGMYQIPRTKIRRISNEIKKNFFILGITLTGNKLLMHAFSSIECVLLPQCLVQYGYSQSDALSLFGVLTGMALALIFFPSVLINSLCVLLLPEVSEATANKNTNRIQNILYKILWFGFAFGIFFGVFFFVTRHLLANLLFQNALVANYLGKLCFLCPLLYICGLLQSVMHGQGQSRKVLEINIFSSLIRIAAIWFLVPKYGIDFYIWSLIISHVFELASELIVLRNSPIS